MTIKDIVLNNFGLNEESKKRFSERFDNPFVEDVFKGLIDENYRIRTPLPRDLYNDFDRGWLTLKNIAPKFVDHYDITYEDFYKNKKNHKKNTFRVIKLIHQYFNKNMDILEYHSFLKRMRSFEEEKFSKLREYCMENDIGLGDFDSLDKAVSLFIDRINELRFSKTQDIEVVISLNPIDWFLSTTGESWRTCLSLESPSFASYWVSLAGSVVDKNLSMIYVTNGDKKTYKGITMDKVLSRSWVLLDESNKLNVVKFYPNEILDVNSLNQFLPISIKPIDRTTYKSKYRVYPLYFSNGYTNYIYQDKTTPSDIKDNSFILKGGVKGLKTIINNKVFEGPIFEYTGGLSFLIDKNRSIIEFFRNPVECCSCGSLVSFGRNIRQDNDGNFYCENCNIPRRKMSFRHTEEDYFGNEDEFDEDDNPEDEQIHIKIPIWTTKQFSGEDIKNILKQEISMEAVRRYLETNYEQDPYEIDEESIKKQNTAT